MTVCRGARGAELVVAATSDDALLQTLLEHPLLFLPELAAAWTARAGNKEDPSSHIYGRAASRIVEISQALRDESAENYGAILGNCALALINEEAGDPVANTSRAIDLIREARCFFSEASEQSGLSLLHEGIAHSTLAERGCDQLENLMIAERAFRQAAAGFPVDSAWAGGCMMNLAQIIALRVRFGFAPTSSLSEAVSFYQQARARLPRGARDLPNCLAGEAEARLKLAKHGIDPVRNLQVSADLYRAARVLVPPQDERTFRWLADRAAALSMLAEHGVRSRENLEMALRDLQSARSVFSSASDQFATCLFNETSIRLQLATTGVDVDANLHAILESSAGAAVWFAVDRASSVGLLLNGAAAYLELANRGTNVTSNFSRALRLCAHARRMAGNLPDLATRCALLEGTTRSAIGEAGINSRRQLTRAVRLFRDVRAARPPNASDVLAVLLNEALARERLACVGVDPGGQLDIALALYQEAQPLASPGSAGLVRCLIGESRVRVIQAEIGERTEENLTSAVRLSSSVVEICRAEGFISDLAIALITKATALQALAESGVDRVSKLDAAIATYDEAIAVTRGAALVRYLGKSLMNQGTALLARGEERGHSASDLLRAISLFQEAALLFPPDDSAAFECVLNEGIAYQYLFQSGVDSDASLERALLLFSRAGEQLAATGHSRSAMSAFKNLGMLLLDQGRAQEAVGSFDRAIAASEQIRDGTVLPQDRQRWLEDQASLFMAAVEACLASGFDGRALEHAERGRARGLQDLLNYQTLDRADLPGDLSTRVRDLRQQAAAIEASLSSLSPQVQGARYETARARVETERRRVREEIATLQQEIGGLNGAAPVAVPSLAIDEILTLPDRVARPVVVLSVGHKHSTAFLITSGRGLETIAMTDLNVGVVARWLVGSPEEGLFGGWMGTYIRYREGQVSTNSWRTVMDKVLREIYTKLMKPIHRRLRDIGVRKVVLVASGHLSILPLHAASWDEEGRTRYVADEIEILYAPATSVLKHAVERRYGEPERFLGVMTSGLGAPLKFAEWEISRLAGVVGDRLGRSAVHTLCGESAIRSQVIRLMSTCQWLHFSCHGVTNPTDPRDSALALHRGERLGLSELLTLQPPPNSRLVVMSACETAVSTTALTFGGEFLGLPAGWMVAGTSSVVGSLWTVGDMPTALLMVRMSELLIAGNEIPTALAEAQRWLRNLDSAGILAEFESDPLVNRDLLLRARAELRGRERPFAHPENWAAFVAYGSPVPLFGARNADGN